MITNLEDFKEQIKDKLFISIESSQDLLKFTKLDTDGANLRNAATNANVIVFLPTINKIWARNAYYGISEGEYNELSSRLSSLESQIQEFGTTLSNNTTNITNLIQLIGENKDSNNNPIINNENGIIGELAKYNIDINSLIELVGENKDSNDNPIINNANGIIGEIVSLRNSIASLTPGGTDFSTLVDSAVNNALNNQLENALSLSNTIITINNSLTQLQQRVNKIPFMSLQVVNDLPTSNISTNTIYLKRSDQSADPDNNEIFTEYIYINLNENKKNPETGQDAEEEWGWESLGRQYFNVKNYLELSNDDFDQIRANIEESIRTIQIELNNSNIAQIAINTNNISNLQTVKLDKDNLKWTILDNNTNDNN